MSIALRLRENEKDSTHYSWVMWTETTFILTDATVNIRAYRACLLHGIYGISGRKRGNGLESVARNASFNVVYAPNIIER